jgi:hypothetical protein
MTKKPTHVVHQHLSREHTHRLAHELLSPTLKKLRFDFGLCPQDGLAVLAETTAILASIVSEVIHVPSAPRHTAKASKKKASKKKVKA